MKKIADTMENKLHQLRVSDSRLNVNSIHQTHDFLNKAYISKHSLVRELEALITNIELAYEKTALMNRRAYHR